MNRGKGRQATDKPAIRPITVGDPEAQSADVVAANLEKLKALFPEVVSEDGVNVDVLNQLIGGTFTDANEKYGLNWSGKRDARQLALMPSTGTLRPCPDESVNWDTTQNLFIEGDNLEVLKVLQKSYHRKVKMIYIDPPYNTGGEFIYPDKYQDNLQTYLRYTGQVDKEGLKLSANSETSGRYHTNWLNMMYPRLKLARNLLRDDGVIAVHIDEHEQHSLAFLMNEVFGEESHLGTCVWDKRNPKGDARGIAYQHESIAFFARDPETLFEKTPLRRKKRNAEKMIEAARQAVGSCSTMSEAERQYREWLNRQDGLSGGEAMYSKLSSDGRVYRLVSMAWPNKKQAPDSYFTPLVHPKTGKPCPVPARGWRNSPETMRKLQEKNLIEFGSDEMTQPQRRYYLEENMYENISSIISFGGSDDVRFRKWGIQFENPKPVLFAADLIGWCTSDGEIVLDFFAGSATSGHGVWIANEKDGGARKFILIQLPEPTKNKNYPTIAHIGRERLQYARKDIEQGDLGFKVFRLDSSNIKLWDADFGNLEKALFDSIENIKPNRSETDVLYELLLKYGLDLAVPIEERKIAGKTIYIIGVGALIVCLANNINLEVVEGIATLKEELKPEVMRVVFKDSGFADDSIKTNAVQILRQAEIEDVKSL